MIRSVIAAALLVVATPYVASAEADGCTTVDYQGAPVDICPEREPDPTNCYTGDYQGAPVEVCMPTGDTLPPGSIDMATGEAPVIHVSSGYVPPVAAPLVDAANPIPQVVEADPVTLPVLPVYPVLHLGDTIRIAGTYEASS